MRSVGSLLRWSHWATEPVYVCVLLQLLHADKRREYLYQLQEFMVTDNSRNWRFRYELAEYVSFQFNLNCVNHISGSRPRK